MDWINFWGLWQGIKFTSTTSVWYTRQIMFYWKGRRWALWNRIQVNKFKAEIWTTKCSLIGAKFLKKQKHITEFNILVFNFSFFCPERKIYWIFETESFLQCYASKNGPEYFSKKKNILQENLEAFLCRCRKIKISF